MKKSNVYWFETIRCYLTETGEIGKDYHHMMPWIGSVLGRVTIVMAVRVQKEAVYYSQAGGTERAGCMETHTQRACSTC